MPENEKGNLMVFQQKKHDLKRLLIVAGDAPHVLVKPEEVKLDHVGAVVEFPGINPADVPKIITVFRFEGKLVILTGHADALASIAKNEPFKARLISTPGLKKARIVPFDDQPASSSPTPSQPDFANRPRWAQNTSAPRSPYRGVRK